MNKASMFVRAAIVFTVCIFTVGTALGPAANAADNGPTAASSDSTTGLHWQMAPTGAATLANFALRNGALNGYLCEGNYCYWQWHKGYQVHLQNTYSGRCLDADLNGNLYTSVCDSGTSNAYQIWHWYGQQLRQKASNYKRCLDWGYTNPCNGGRYQDWYAE